MAILADLMLRLRANSADLQKGLDQSKNAMKNAGKESTKLGKTISGAFSEASKQIDKVIPGFSKFTSGIAKAIPSVNGLSGALKIMKVALISTGIGAIVVALGTLIAYFKNTKSGADQFNKALGGIKAVISTLMHRINLLGEAISLLLKGQFKEAAEKAKEAFANLGDEIKQNAQAGIALAERENQLNKDKIAFKIRESELTRDIARSMEIANDENYSLVERQKAAANAEKLTRDLANERIKLGEEELDILTKKNALGDNTYADDMAEAEKRAEINGMREEESQKMRRILSTQESIAKEAETEAKAREDALAALKEENKIIPVSVESFKPKPLDTNTLAPEPTAVFEQPKLDVATQAWVDYKDGVIGIWEMIETQALSTFNNISQSAVDVGAMLADTLINSVVGLTEAFGNLFAGAEAGFKGVVTAALQSIQQIINALLAQAIAGMIAGEGKKGIVGLITASIGVSALLALWKSKVPEFATGTNFAPGGLSLVGERGPELVNLPRGSAVYNNRLTQSALAGGGGMNITVDGVIRGNDLALVLRRADTIN